MGGDFTVDKAAVAWTPSPNRSGIFRMGLCWFPTKWTAWSLYITEERTATKTTSGSFLRIYTYIPFLPEPLQSQMSNTISERIDPHLTLAPMFHTFLRAHHEESNSPKLHCWWSRGLIVDPLHLVPQETCCPILLLLRENIRHFCLTLTRRKKRHPKWELQLNVSRPFHASPTSNL